MLWSIFFINVPMHYRSDTFGYDKIARAEEFTALRDDVRQLDTNTLELTPETSAMTALLRYMGQ